MTDRNVYLSMIPLQDARKRVKSVFGTILTKTTRLPAKDAIGRILAAPVFAKTSSPPFHVAAMDGYAVRAADTFHASQSRPLFLSGKEDAAPVNTGQPLPEGFDAVIMIEDVVAEKEDRLRIEAPAFPWQHVRKIGEDIVATELLFPGTHEITPYCIGALLSGGVREVPVYARPRVLILPTGNELVSPDRDPALLQPGEVIESNSHVLGHLVEGCGGEWVRHAPVSDDANALTRLLTTLAKKEDLDMILTVGGSSAGAKDFTRKAVETAGRLHIHGVTMMPGKPVVMGEINQKPVFGIPGYPVSAIVAFEQLVRPLIRRMMGRPDLPPATAMVAPSRPVPSRLGTEEFLRVRLGRVEDRIVATPLPRGAGCITSITEADGIIRIPGDCEGIPAATPVRAELLRPLEEIEDTLVVVGSHDNTLDILADMLKREGVRISSSHVGSMGGLLAIRNQACHLAGAHLLDTETGTYNTSYIRRVLQGIPVMRLHLVVREQGFMVQPGNPKGIQGVRDLVRPDVRLINRQPGSGTRILLDYELKGAEIDPSAITGYTAEETTHMAVAAAVAGGAADAGLGILAAAKALGLDFVPVTAEEYDLIFPESLSDSPQIQALLQTVRSESFQEKVRVLGGYDTTRTGTFLPV